MLLVTKFLRRKYINQYQKKNMNLNRHYNKKDAELIIFGESSDKIMYTLANCCKPIPGDDVFGFVTQGEGP